MKSDPVELGRDGQTVFFTRYTICGNAETLCDGREVGAWQDEAAAGAVSAAAAVLRDRVGDYDRSATFADWHGGRFHAQSPVALTFFRAECNSDGADGEAGEACEKTFCAAHDVPAELAAKAAEIRAAAEEAAEDELRSWERHAAELTAQPE